MASTLEGAPPTYITGSNGKKIQNPKFGEYMRNKKLGKLEEKKSVMEDLERKISATTVEDDVFRAVQKDSDDDVVLSQSEKRLVDLSQEWEIDRAFESNPGA
mmetsp:Transcript_23965/g.52443  ORF Transcript_23965/g.52443 Transcript_23965/m.52443 type:complete len:102 (-) Transcript_23965:3567-3872(-)